MDKPEIVLNLWYVHDEDGFIYSLRARCYVASGTDEEKLSLLRESAVVDYLIAQQFPIPEQFHTKFVGTSVSKKLGVVHKSHLAGLDSPIAIFEDAFKQLNSKLPATTKLSIPQDPVAVITPLSMDENGELRPQFEGRVKIE